MLKRTIAHYQIVEKLGEGGMGIVYKARDTRLERMAALKVLPPDKTADPDRKRRFVQEAKAASALNHPNIITIYDIGADDGVDFIAMEYVSGRALDALIPRQGMQPAEVLRIAVQMADALAAAHAAGIIHRDLKPGNIMVADSGLVKVLDFGLAKLTETSGLGPDATTATLAANPTEEGTILGTIAYLSPEQAQGLKLDPRSDIFSFGAVLYEMLTGRQAFRGETKVSTIAAILNREPEPLAETTPRELDRIVHRCLRKDPARRFQTMADLKVALEELKDESDSGRLASDSVAVARKRSWPFVIAGVAILLLAVAGAWWMWGRRPAPAAGARNLRQLTYDDASTEHPGLSSDAMLVAYDSDRAEEGKFDIWVQQTSGGSAIQLTKGPGNHSFPVFSGDGSKIYYESSGPPQGIYEISAIGGEPRLIAADGMRPRVSPDGKNVAYVGPLSSQLFVVPTSGGEPQAIAPGFAVDGTSFEPLWSPDSRLIAFYASKNDRTQDFEWWWMPASGGTPQQIAWIQWAAEHRFAGMPTAWLSGNVTVSWLERDGNTQIYRIQNSSAATGLRILEEPQPLTFGGSLNQYASLAAGKMAFQSGTRQSAIWSLPADTNQGRVSGALEKLTTEKANYGYVAATPDGKNLTFISDRTGGKGDVFLRDMASGQEHAIAADEPDKYKQFAQINASGTEVFFTMSNAAISFDVYVVPAQGGAKRKICAQCGGTESLSPDGRQFLVSLLDSPRAGVNLVDIASGKSTLILEHSRYLTGTPRFSPDGKWILFLMFRDAGSTDVMLAPFRGASSVPEQDWITVTQAPAYINQAFWSPDGGLLYYVISSAGTSSLMARRLDRNRHPAGPPFRVFQFPGRNHPHAFLEFGAWYQSEVLSALPGRFVGAMSEYSYNIWMMDLPK
jgi:serine/threonine protein kinase